MVIIMVFIKAFILKSLRLKGKSSFGLSISSPMSKNQSTRRLKEQ